MNRQDARSLREFYASALGRAVRRDLQAAVRRHWPSLSGDTLLGIGYANPVLRAYLVEEKQPQALIFSVMPAVLGATVWPHYQASRVALVDEQQLPVRHNQCNRLLVMHALEATSSESALLQECWRVLTPGGRVLLVVPHRRSIWARTEHSPFAHGRPYRLAQIQELLTRHHFTIIHHSSALHFIPSQRRFWLRLARPISWLAETFLPHWGGVLLIEAEKQLYAGVRERVHEKRPAYAVATTKPALSRKGSSA